MSYHVLLATPDAALAAQAAALMVEDGELEVVGTIDNATDVMESLDASTTDIVVLHEDLGPLPVMDLAREIGTRFPQTAVVLIVRERTPEVLRAALQAGARDVLSLPLSFEELQGMKAAGAWSQMVRERVTGGLTPTLGFGLGGTMVAVAGAKGGVGTTTLATYLALEAASISRARTVCLVDFDLQAGDVAILLDLKHRRSVADLLDVVDEISPRVLEDALYVHPSGLRVLLAPEAGEQEEDITGVAARRLLGALKTNFDIVIVDVGTVVTEANSVAVEVADQVLLVATPDVPALRAANRLIGLWERLEIRKEGFSLVLNRIDKDNEVQPDLVRKVVDAPLARSVVPSSFRNLEAAINTGVPTRLGDGSVRAALRKLAEEIGVVPRPERRKRLVRESGSVAIETVGMASIIVLFALFMWQIVLVGLTFVFAGHAAREGASAMSVGENVTAAVREDITGAWRSGVEVREGSDWVQVRLTVPVIVPGIGSPFKVTGRSGAVIEESLAGPPRSEAR